MTAIRQLFNKLLKGRANEHEPDKGLIITVGLIIIFGLIMLSSATSAYAYIKHADSYYFFKHQLFGLGLGLK